MKAVASKRAVRYIAGRGGCLYVWFTALGRSDWALQHVATKPPEGVTFTQRDADGFQLFLPAGYETSERIEVVRRYWPFGPLEVTGTGAGQGESVGHFEA